MSQNHQWNQQYGLYLPRILVDWQLSQDTTAHLDTDGTFLLVDISGFTALSETLAEKGKVGAEEVTEILNEIFTELLDIASLDGGDLLRFGGDALFHLFTGSEHARRAARVALDMRAALDEFEVPDGKLAMSVGIASGAINGYLAGSESQELLFVGPTASQVVRLQSAALPGEILVADSTVTLIDDNIFADGHDSGLLLVGDPEVENEWEETDPESGSADLRSFIPAQLREQISLAFNQGEHRPATIAFVGFDGTDAHDQARLGEDLDRLVSIVQDAASRNGITFLASDVDDDGGKLILATGVPTRSASRGERMIRALREIVDADPPFDIHIGVARGHVFAGDLGARFRRVYTVMGDTVNLAARLAAAAQPSEILVTARALDRSSDVFDTEPTPALSLKGKTKSVSPMRILGLVAVEGARSGRTHDIVGRVDEFAQIDAIFRDTLAGNGHVIQISGPPGIGKTTLLSEAASRNAISFETVYTDCEQYEANTPYYTAGKMLRSLMSIKPARAEDLGSDLLDFVNGEAPTLGPWTPLLADIIGADVPMTPEVDALDQQFIDAKTREAAVALVRLTQSAALFLVFDDYHWIDPASRALVESLATATSANAVAIGLANRENMAEIFPDSVQIALAPLSPTESVELVTLASPEPVPVPVAQAIAKRSSGNPFVIVELVHSGLSLEQGELPETIEAVTLARIDMLAPPDRRLLRIASVLGETFALNLVADALPDIAPVAQDIEAWRRLEDFLDVGSTGTVRFRQAIVRDAAYEGLPFRQRREIHQAVGDALERRARRRPERFAEVMSLHFEQGESWDKAWEYAIIAGNRAQAKYANAEAYALFQRAVRVGTKIERQDLSSAHEASADSAAIIGLYDEAEASLDAGLGNEASKSVTSRLLRKKGLLYVRRGNLDEADRLLHLSIDVLGGLPVDTEGRRSWMLAHIALAGQRMRAGEYQAAADTCTAVIDAPVDHDEFAAERCKAFSSRAAASTHLPHRDGQDDFQMALEISERMHDLLNAVGVHNNLGYDAYYKGDWNQCYQSWLAASAISDKIGDLGQTAISALNIGELRLDQGHFDEAEEAFRRGLTIFRGAKHQVGVAMCAFNLGRLLTRLGKLAVAREWLDESLTLLNDLGASGVLAEGRVRLAEWHLYQHRNDAAREILDTCAAELPEGNNTILSVVDRLRGYAAWQAGDRALATRFFESALALSEDSRHEHLLALESLARISASADPRVAETSIQMGIIARPVLPI